MSINNWNRDQLIVALNLYWKTPYNKISGSTNAQIKQISLSIGRSPAALAYKLMNFTSLDPEKQKLGNKGKSAGSLADKKVWDDYFGKWEELALDSSAILSKMGISVASDCDNIYFGEGIDRSSIVKTRVNQNDFRQRILASYNERCCITGISIPILLVASHIIPWSINEKERLNPKNGVCLNYIHDKAFDRGLITITTDFKIKLSEDILKKKNEQSIQKYFLEYQNKSIILPDRFLPSPEFLEYHNKNIFHK